MLKIDKIYVYYGKACALRELSLEVKKGELVTLVGANGAGKSTLLKTISGLLKTSSGSIKFDNEEIQKLSPHLIVGKGISHVPEGREIFPYLTVQDNLKMGAYLRRDKKGIKEDLESTFELFPVLKERRNQMAGTLSGGERQMLAIGRGLMSGPELLMLDEPSLGLAPILTEKIFGVIKQIHEEREVTTLLVEQDVNWSLSVCSRGYIIENGRIVLEGEGETLLNNDYVRKAYLGY
ncbi:ABC transporter ATP-binding protein [Candidatus Aerophobetes bacterium]|nr:ABC transporter ATP-binding protein [Candidatus Aerophobetes bacterium]